jgi:hypothetical protein
MALRCIANLEIKDFGEQNDRSSEGIDIATRVDDRTRCCCGQAQRTQWSLSRVDTTTKLGDQVMGRQVSEDQRKPPPILNDDPKSVGMLGVSTCENDMPPKLSCNELDDVFPQLSWRELDCSMIHRGFTTVRSGCSGLGTFPVKKSINIWNINDPIVG